MQIMGAELLERLLAGDVYEVKMVFNERGAIIFAASRQHRDVKAEGISYEDNALAALLRRDLVEIRFHQSFNDATVTDVLHRLVKLDTVGYLVNVRITYQGRPIVL